MSQRIKYVIIILLILAFSGLIWLFQKSVSQTTKPTKAVVSEASLSLQGRVIAEQYCAGCHAVTGGEDSPNRDAPPFILIAERRSPEKLEDSMARGITVGHETQPMPVFNFTPEEMNSLIAYFKELKSK